MTMKLDKWRKLGRILAPRKEIPWMATFTGPSFAVQRGSASLFDVYVTGRDEQNRSRIGKVVFDLEDREKGVFIEDKPIFDLGELGCFDENGVSYPVIVEHEGQRHLYYVGWVPTVLTPFQNFIGLALAQKGRDNFVRFSRAPILERNNEEPFSSGSVDVMKEEDGLWRMWYTSFLRWGAAGEHKHYYVIKYAESQDGIHWRREGKICINIQGPSEYAIGKPSVFKYKNRYYMWYVYRGEQYRIGFAVSADGVVWERKDHLAGIDVSPTGWDSEAISYPHVFRYQDKLYMLYCGNDYGRAGLGIAEMTFPTGRFLGADNEAS